MHRVPWPLHRDDVGPTLSALRSGALVVYPTETVFGIGCVLSAGEAGIERVRAAKGSPPGRPFLVLAASREMAFSLWSEVPPVGLILGTSEWPGPLTLVGPARQGLPKGLLGESDGPDGVVSTVSVRVPGDPALRQLIGRLGEPLLSTSANPAGSPPPVDLAAVDLESLSPDLLLAAGSCPGGEPSTVLTVVEDPPRVLRQGAWHPQLLEAASE
ncbi:MAG: L-threonylcarbamoyladenylate synthase [Deltaproteobacteria bacterium]|nr:L-threonylcarbamoyladenylate synthase [Deltaproteobacteria bacterium]